MRRAHQLRSVLFPPNTLTTTNWDRWTAQALTGPLWEQQFPAYSLLWLSEPDQSQHETGPGSPASLAAIRNADKVLARVLAALDQKGLGPDTDVIVVSDHGFSTIEQRCGCGQDTQRAWIPRLPGAPARTSPPRRCHGHRQWGLGLSLCDRSSGRRCRANRPLPASAAASAAWSSRKHPSKAPFGFTMSA